MRPVREITSEEENFRIVRDGPFELMRRDPVEPEPVGTIVLMAFRVVEYGRDCDGSALATLDKIDRDGRETGASINSIGLRPDSCLVVTMDELKAIFDSTG